MGSADAKVFADNFKKTMSDEKNKKWFKHLFSYPFGIPGYDNSGYFNFPNYNFMPDYQRIQNLNRYFNGFPNQ